MTSAWHLEAQIAHELDTIRVAMSKSRASLAWCIVRTCLLGIFQSASHIAVLYFLLRQTIPDPKNSPKNSLKNRESVERLSGLLVFLRLLTLCAFSLSMSNLFKGCRERLERCRSALTGGLHGSESVARVVKMVLECVYYHAHPLDHQRSPQHMRSWCRHREKRVRTIVVSVCRGVVHGVMCSHSATTFLRDMVYACGIARAQPKPLPTGG